MTTRQKFEQMLTEAKVAKEHAVIIMDLAIPVIDSKYGDITWDSPAEEYYWHFYGGVYNDVIMAVAMDWLSENVWKS